MRLVAPVVAVLLVGACSTTVSRGADPTVSSQRLADLASTALAREVGAEPDDLDCGDEEVEVVEGAVVDCLLTDAGTTFDTTVTLREVDGADFRVAVEVAETPRTS